jgi:energy-converting hydrogenase B subunit J
MVYFYAGPTILGFLLGLILGSRVKISSESKLNFTLGSFVVILIAASVIAYLEGPFPYYAGLPLAPGFISGILGIIIGKETLGRFAKDDHNESNHEDNI